jgi:hypothetical protein
MMKFAHRTYLALSGFMFSIFLGAAASAQDAPKLTGVVELFTSQGCSSCPPADAALEEFIKRDDVLALAFHVDYWDYIGWKDTLASPENTARQYEYRKTFNTRSVYTPQAIINGRAHEVGSRGSAIRQKLAEDSAQGHGLTIPVSISENGARISVQVDDGPMPDAAGVKLMIVYFNTETPVQIERGENAGKKIFYRNSVIDTEVLGMWDGMSMSVDIPATEIEAHKADGFAVLLQSITNNKSPGAILGAAKLIKRKS